MTCLLGLAHVSLVALPHWTRTVHRLFVGALAQSYFHRLWLPLNINKAHNDYQHTIKYTKAVNTGAKS